MGAPPEEQMTLDAAVEDAGLRVDWLREALPGCPIALIGHSEGALIACMTARMRSIAALVLLAGIGRRLEAVMAGRIATNMTEPLAGKARATLAELAAGRRVASMDPALAALFRPGAQSYLISSLTRDPVAELAAFDGPALIVGGGRDTQVSRADFDRLSAAKARATAIWLETMNHVLKDIDETVDANRAAHADPTPPLASGLSGAISAFLLAQRLRRRTKSHDAATNRGASGLSIMLNPFETGSLR
jgi:pimeloyl-ACP methyl ester carboxylesterase